MKSHLPPHVERTLSHSLATAYCKCNSENFRRKFSIDTNGVMAPLKSETLRGKLFRDFKEFKVIFCLKEARPNVFGRFQILNSPKFTQ